MSDFINNIFLVSIVPLGNNTAIVKYLLCNIIEIDDYKGLLEFSYLTTDYTELLRIPIGKWQKVKLNRVGHIVHIFN